MRDPSSCIHHLLSPACDPDLTSSSEEHPHIIDLVIEPSVSNHSSIMLLLKFQ